MFVDYLSATSEFKIEWSPSFHSLCCFLTTTPARSKIQGEQLGEGKTEGLCNGRTLVHAGPRHAQCPATLLLRMVTDANLLDLRLSHITFLHRRSSNTSVLTSSRMVEISNLAPGISQLEYSRGHLQYILCLSCEKSAEKRTGANVRKAVLENGIQSGFRE